MVKLFENFTIYVTKFPNSFGKHKTGTSINFFTPNTPDFRIRKFDEMCRLFKEIGLWSASRRSYGFWNIKQ